MRHFGTPVSQDTKINWHIARQLLPYLAEFKFRIVGALLLLVLAKLATIAMPFLLKAAVDSYNPPQNDSVESWSVKLMLLGPIALVVAYGLMRFLTTFFGELRDTLFSRVTERVMRRVGTQVFEHLLFLDLNFHLNRKTGALARDIERGISGISFLLRFLVFNIVPTLLEIGLVIGILLFNYGLWFGVITAAAVISYILFSMYATNWRAKFIRAANEADSDSSAQSVDSLLNFETVKYFNNEDYEIGRYDVALESWENAKQKNRFSLMLLNSGQAIIISGAVTAMLVLAATEVSSGNMSLGDFVLINAFMMQLFIPLNFLGFVYREIRASMVNIENMMSLLQAKPDVTDNENAIDAKFELGEVEFQNIAFGYHKDRNILQDVSFRVKAGSKIAIVGASGAGKSTITKLLFRFYDPITGKITIDGKDISQLTQKSLRSQLAIVPQDTVLFNQSILENVRYGRPEASDEDVLEAIGHAHLSRLIEQLPKGVDTLVGERGLKLSGGEKQRVAIARAFLRQPKILIFDEATSSLDSEAEKSILQALKEISQNVTTISIAHRLSTVADSDQIFVMDNGVIVERGNHQQLLENNGRYSALWRAQQQ